LRLGRIAVAALALLVLGGVAWVRVARPQRQWFQRLLRDPHAQIVRGGVAQPVIAKPQKSAEWRAAISVCSPAR